jgi:hypothetical protein
MQARWFRPKGDVPQRHHGAANTAKALSRDGTPSATPKVGLETTPSLRGPDFESGASAFGLKSD